MVSWIRVVAPFALSAALLAGPAAQAALSLHVAWAHAAGWELAMHHDAGDHGHDHDHPVVPEAEAGHTHHDHELAPTLEEDAARLTRSLLEPAPPTPSALPPVPGPAPDRVRAVSTCQIAQDRYAGQRSPVLRS